MVNLTATHVMVITVLFFSTFIRSAFGFGDALLAMPLLVMLINPQTAAPLVACIAFTIAITILLKSWRDVDIKAAWRLIALSLVGIPIGVQLLKTAPEHIIKAILGIVLILFGLYNLIAPRLPKLKWQGWTYIFGFVAGILGGAYNTNGPPIVIYSTLRRWPPQRFRATLQGYFFSTGVLLLANHALAGLWTPDVLRLYAYSLPIVMLAIFLGGKVNQSIPRGRFERFINGFLVLMGVFLLSAFHF